MREVELTSYAEVVLAPHAADVAHPAFSNLFIETEFVAAENALLARRRPRSSKDEPAYAVHVVVTDGERVGAVQYETDRSRFLGRGHTAADPVAVVEDRPLSNTVGAVLDPVFSLRQRVRLQPGETARVSFTTAVARSREEALALADKYHDPSIFERAARLAWTQSQVEMRHHNVDADEAHLFQRLAGRVLYADPSLRPRPHVLALNTKAQSALWPYGISGDLPIVIVRVSRDEDVDVVRQLIRGHEYLRLKGLTIDLVILNDHPPTYIQELQDGLLSLIRSSGSQALQDKPGGVFLRRTDIMPEADRILLHAAARVVIVPERGTLAEQLTRREIEEPLPPDFAPRGPARAYAETAVEAPELSFFNGLGGFSQRRPRVRDDSARGTVDARAVGERHRQRTRFRLSGDGDGRRLHVVCEQPREPAHALVERRRERPAGRGHLPARRRERRRLDADAAARARRRPVRRPARAGLHGLRAHEPRHHAGAAALRAARRAGQDFRAAPA